MIIKFKIFENNNLSIILKDDCSFDDLKEYLKNGGDPNVKINDNLLLYLTVYSNNDALKKTKLLVNNNYGKDAEVPISLFTKLILQRKHNMIDILYDSVNINEKDENGYTPLILTAYMCNVNNIYYKKKIIDLLYRLIEDDADWNITTKNTYFIDDNKDFLDILYKKAKETYYNVIRKYHDKYVKYLRRKEIDKFNI